MTRPPPARTTCSWPTPERDLDGCPGRVVRLHGTGDGQEDSGRQSVHFPAYYQYGGVRVADNGVGGTTEQYPLEGTEAVASNDREPRAQLLGEPCDLRVRATDLRVNRRDFAAIIPYLSRLLAEALLGVVFDFLQVVLGVRRVDCPLGYALHSGHGFHIDEVHLCAELARQLGRHAPGATGFREPSVASKTLLPNTLKVFSSPRAPSKGVFCRSSYRAR
jgi:hypothetical protein